MEAKTPHTRGAGDSGARPCRCGNKISSRDPHQVCSGCLGLEHARQAIDVPGSCQHCTVFTLKSLRRRLARQASLSGLDPYLPPDDHRVDTGEERGAAAEATLRTSASWGSQLDLAQVPLPEEDVLELDYREEYDDDIASELLISEDDDEDDLFVTPVRAAKPATSAASRDGDESSTPASPLPSSDMLDVCKRAADRLAIPWPAVVAETTRSRYEGKKLPLAKSATRQLLPVFPELLDEVARSWKDRPYSSRSPIPGASSLDCEAMESLGLLRMPPMEPLVAAHLHPRLSTVSSRSAALPLKSDRFQSALTEKTYKAAALSARALNVLSMLTAYQAELCEDFAQAQDAATWEEIMVITDLCLRIQRCAVQATGRAMGTMVLQERARWLNLANLSDREKDDILDMPIVPEGVFGSALASMQRRCEAKKKEDEALQLCLPRKSPDPSPTAQRKTFAQTASQGSQFKIPRRPRPQPAPPSLPSQEPRPGWHRKSPVPTDAPPPQPAQTVSFQARKKKRAA